jgi:hypothetical protein
MQAIYKDSNINVCSKYFVDFFVPDANWTQSRLFNGIHKVAKSLNVFFISNKYWILQVATPRARYLLPKRTKYEPCSDVNCGYATSDS